MSAPIIVVCGPTASRKSELALRLAQRLDGAVICCDSVQIYRGFRIGSAAPTDEELAAAPHELYGVLESNERSDAGLYTRLADAAIERVRAAGLRPIFAGGTGLYLRALMYGLADVPPVPGDVRQRLGEELERAGIGGLWSRLQAVDPASAERIQGGSANTQRVLRALEVYEGTGERLSDLQDAHEPAPRHEVIVLVPAFERSALYARIDARVDAMIEAGLVAEVAGLLADGVARDSRPMSALGYRQIAAHLAGESTLEEAVARTRLGHRRYARRQQVWFKSVEGARLLDAARPTLFEDALREIGARA